MTSGVPKTKERLDQRRLAFVDNLFRGLNQTRAYCEAYTIDTEDASKYDSARTHAARLVASGPVADEIARRRRLLDKSSVATAERIAQELAAIALVDPVGEGFFRIVDGQVYLRDTVALPESLSRAIAEMHQTEHGLRVRFHSKEAALRMLGQWRKMFVDKLEVDISNRLAERMAKAHARRVQAVAPKSKTKPKGKG